MRESVSNAMIQNDGGFTVDPAGCGQVRTSSREVKSVPLYRFGQTMSRSRFLRDVSEP